MYGFKPLATSVLWTRSIRQEFTQIFIPAPAFRRYGLFPSGRDCWAASKIADPRDQSAQLCSALLLQGTAEVRSRRAAFSLKARLGTITLPELAGRQNPCCVVQSPLRCGRLHRTRVFLSHEQSGPKDSQAAPGPSACRDSVRFPRRVHSVPRQSESNGCLFVIALPLWERTIACCRSSGD